MTTHAVTAQYHRIQTWLYACSIKEIDSQRKSPDCQNLGRKVNNPNVKKPVAKRTGLSDESELVSAVQTRTLQASDPEQGPPRSDGVSPSAALCAASERGKVRSTSGGVPNQNGMSSSMSSKPEFARGACCTGAGAGAGRGCMGAGAGRCAIGAGAARRCGAGDGAAS